MEEPVVVRGEAGRVEVKADPGGGLADAAALLLSEDGGLSQAEAEEEKVDDPSTEVAAGVTSGEPETPPVAEGETAPAEGVETAPVEETETVAAAKTETAPAAEPEEVKEEVGASPQEAVEEKVEKTEVDPGIFTPDVCPWCRESLPDSIGRDT